ncbi:MAG: ABC transporter substrate-binding protein [Fuerstiella sp.]
MCDTVLSKAFWKSSLAIILLTTCGLSLLDAEKLHAQDRATAEPSLPKYEDMQLPSARVLKNEDSVDWIVLTDGRVLVTTPVYPRPNTLKTIQDELRTLEKATGGNAAQRRARTERRKRLRNLTVVLPSDVSTDLYLPVSQIDQVILHEDLCLRRVDQLLEADEITQAYELLLHVEQELPGWDNSQPSFEKLLATEARLKVKNNDDSAAMAILDELAGRNIDNPDLREILAGIVDRRVADAASDKRFDSARYNLSRLTRHFPQDAVAEKWKTRLKNRSDELLRQARELFDQKKYRDAALVAQEADFVWKTSGSARAVYTELVARYQFLRVPVGGFGDVETVFPISSRDQRRDSQLTSVPLFEAAAADELTYFQSSFFEDWDPTDLGREVVFSVRQTRPYWQSQPLLTANQIADSLSIRLDSSLPTFDARLASFVKEFAVRSPTELQVVFNRVPLNLEAMFRFPVTTLERGDDPDAGPQSKLLSTRFVPAAKSDRSRTYLRSVDEPDGLLRTQYHVAELIEKKYEDRESEVRAFSKGELDVLPHLRPWEIDIFKYSGSFSVQKYRLPQTHVLTFNPKSEAVTNPQLRRALSFGVDREGLLKKVILRDAEMQHGRPAKAPWNSRSYANSPLVQPPKYDLYLSFLLKLAAQEKLRVPGRLEFVAAAKKRIEDAGEEWKPDVFRRENAAAITKSVSHITLPRLRFVVEDDPVAMLAAEKMVERWKALKFDIELIPGGQPGKPLADDEWDVMYRVTRMEEPLLDLWPLMLTDEQLDVSRLETYPDWMRQELINLDYATSFPDARGKLFQIHRHMSAQAFIVPLWELDDYIAFQRSVAGFESQPLSVYQSVEKWQVIP